MTSDTLHTAFIGLGSNLGKSKTLLATSWKRLGTHPQVDLKMLSSPYKTPPYDMESPNWFVNAVGALQTDLTPLALLELLLKIEKEFGRIRSPGFEGHQDRTLDLDLLLYDDLVLHTDRLVLPHPEMDKRLFVLRPLQEIMPEKLHPVNKSCVSDMIEVLCAREEIGKIVKMAWHN